MALTFKVNGDASGAIADLKKLGYEVEVVGKELDKVGDKGKKAGKDVGSGFKEAGKEAGQSGREAAASFSGGFDDVADFAQETIANAFGGFGPAAAAAGIAVAAVIGSILSQAASAQEALNEARASAGDLAKELYENKGELPLQSQVDRLFDTLSKEIRPNGPIQKLIDDYVDFGSALDGIGIAAKQIGRPLDDLKDALSGNDLDESKRLLKEVNDEIKRLENTGTSLVWDRAPLEDYRTSLQKIVEEYRIAEGLNTPEVMAAKRVDELATAWDNARAKLSDYLSAGDTGAEQVFDLSGYITDLETQVAQAAELKQDLVTLPPGVRAAAEEAWREGGAGAADAFVDAYQNADAETRARLEAIVGTQGTAAGAAAANAFITQAELLASGWKPPQVNIPVGIYDVTNAEGFRQSVANRLGTITVPVQLGPGWGSPLG
jgi:hypothetical protein